MILIKNGILSLPIPDIILSSLGGLSPLISLLIIQRLFYKNTDSPKFLNSILKTAKISKNNRTSLMVSTFIFPIFLIVSNFLNYMFKITNELRFLADGVNELKFYLILIIPINFFAGLLTSPLFEEPGWRGFALSNLDKYNKPLISSLIVGSYWWLWHQGMNIAFGLMPSFFNYFDMLAMSFLIDNLFRLSKNNLLVAMFAHESLGIVKVYLYNIEMNYINTIFYVVGGIIFFIIWIKKFKVTKLENNLENKE